MSVPIKVKRFSRSKEPIVEEEIQELPPTPPPPPPSPPVIPKKRGRKKKEEVETTINRIEDDDFLKDLTNQIIEEKIEAFKQSAEPEPEESLDHHTYEYLPPMPYPSFDAGLFASSKKDATPILGKNHRQLLAKIHQYKELFPQELSNFKLKKNPNEKDLEDALQEMENIVEVGTVESFLTDSILQCLKIVETVSSHSERLNVTGMTEMLRANPQFHKLCKMLYVKYKVFSAIPPEYQMLMLVSTTAMICRQKNVNKGSLDAFLGQPAN